MLAPVVEQFSPQFDLLAIDDVLIGVFLFRCIIFAGSALVLITIFRRLLKLRRLQLVPFTRE